jgi:hypothetical protein
MVLTSLKRLLSVDAQSNLQTMSEDHLWRCGARASMHEL